MDCCQFGTLQYCCSSINITYWYVWQMIVPFKRKIEESSCATILLAISNPFQYPMHILERRIGINYARHLVPSIYSLSVFSMCMESKLLPSLYEIPKKKNIFSNISCTFLLCIYNIHLTSFNFMAFRVEKSAFWIRKRKFGVYHSAHNISLSHSRSLNDIEAILLSTS